MAFEGSCMCECDSSSGYATLYCFMHYAAPELLESLKALVALEPICDDGDERLTIARRNALAAIAKAEGRGQ